MSSATASSPARTASRLKWLVLCLLMASVCINYIDRGNLSVSGVQVSKELGLHPSQLGILLSAFFWTYAIFQVISGWLIDRFDVVWVFAIGYFIWSGTTALTGLLSGYTALLMVRLLLGASESVAYPSYSKIIALGFTEDQRGTANGLVDAASKLGPALGMIVGGTILAHWGWRAVFLSIGLASMLWVAPWCYVGPKLGTHARPELRGGPGILAILKRRDAWGTFIGLFGGNYAWYFMITWIPGYLQMERHYTIQAMSLLGSFPFFCVAGGALTGGWLADRWIRRGGSATLVRKTFICGGLLLSAALILPAAIARDQVWAMTLLSAASFSCGLYSGNLWTITQTLAGPAAAGKWTGLQNGIGNLAGIFAPSITGFIVEYTHSFYFAFLCVSVALIVSALSFLVIVKRVEPVVWDV
jgi:MFS family permease